MSGQFDTGYSNIAFSAKHLMISTVRGRFNTWSGTIEFDEQHPETSRIEVRIDAASVDTNQPQRDAALKSPDFLDVEQYPTITFKSTKVEPSSHTTSKMFGDLTIHGVTKEVILDVTQDRVIRDMQGNRRIGFSAMIAISRKEWGLNWNAAIEAGGVVVGDQINILIEVQVYQPQQALAQTTD